MKKETEKEKKIKERIRYWMQKLKEERLIYKEKAVAKKKAAELASSLMRLDRRQVQMDLGDNILFYAEKNGMVAKKNVEKVEQYLKELDDA